MFLVEATIMSVFVCKRFECLEVVARVLCIFVGGFEGFLGMEVLDMLSGLRWRLVPDICLVVGYRGWKGGWPRICAGIVGKGYTSCIGMLTGRLSR